MGRKLAAALVVLAIAAAAAVAYAAATRDRDYRRLIEAGESALVTGAPGVAIEAFSGAIALKSDSMLAYLKRGETYRLQGDLKAALRDLRTASELDPVATRPLEQLGDVNAALFRHDRAAERYAAYIQLDDRSPRVLYKLGLAHYMAGQASLAEPALRKAIALESGFAEAHHVLGLCLEARGRRREARASLERAISLDPALVPPREALANLYRAEGRHAEATEQLEALVALDRTRPARLMALGLEYADWNRTSLAVVTLGRAAERFPDNVEVYAVLGEVWLRAAAQGDRVALGKALEALRTAVVRGGSGSRELALYGRALLLAGDASAAFRSLREAATKLPVAPAALLDLSHAAQRVGQPREARDALRRYVALLGGERPPAEVTTRIGDLSAALGDRKEAVRWLRQASQPSADVAVLTRLAEAELHNGETDAARRTLDRALSVAPADPKLRRLRQHLH